MGVRDFLRTYGFKIDFSHTTLPEVQCENDEFIMDALCLHGQCSTLDLQHLNACLMFLQVSRLSDMASADGKTIQPDILLGKDDDTLTSLTWWPR